MMRKCFSKCISRISKPLKRLLLEQNKGSKYFGTTIYIDIDAAGHGWFVDFTPEDDEEFEILNGDQLLANSNSEVSDQMDLFTVVMHEIGHVLGFEDIESVAGMETLMSSSIDTGVRRY